MHGLKDTSFSLCPMSYALCLRMPLRHETLRMLGNELGFKRGAVSLLDAWLDS